MSKKYNDKYYARYGDPRTAQWLLMDNQVSAFILAAVYLAVTKWILPRLMRNRNPCKLRKLTIGYNFGMMVLNAWVFYELGTLTWFKPNFKRLCQSVDFSNTENALQVANVGWIFLITTSLECVTTVIIVLKRKDSRLSVIHIFLRMQAPIVVWYGLKFAPGGYNSLYSLLTSFINTLAHFHYGVLAAIPSLRHPHWERFTLPALYMMQFTIVLIYYTQMYFFPPKGCKLSSFILRLNMGSAILFFVFANDFFVSKFKNKNNRSESSKSGKAQKVE